MEIDEKYMWRALELARKGEIGAHPNPMVGAIIVDSGGKIIGEGYHKKCGEGHAEVNAIADAAGKDLSDTTLYVTLEPCSHYGKTPPCAKLIIEKRIPRVVVGMIDPFSKVAGRGIAMMREAGVKVEIMDGEIEAACKELNKRFIKAHTMGMPYVALKWAQTVDGYVDRKRTPEEEALKISDKGGQTAVHRYRSTFDAIAVGTMTERMDRPKLDARLWPNGRAPRRVYFEKGDLESQLKKLYDEGITSILIEGGPTLQQSFIDNGLVDEIRIEISNAEIQEGTAAPKIRIGEKIKIIRQ